MAWRLCERAPARSSSWRELLLFFTLFIVRLAAAEVRGTLLAGLLTSTSPTIVSALEDCCQFMAKPVVRLGGRGDHFSLSTSKKCSSQPVLKCPQKGRLFVGAWRPPRVDQLSNLASLARALVCLALLFDQPRLGGRQLDLGARRLVSVRFEFDLCFPTSYANSLETSQGPLCARLSCGSTKEAAPAPHLPCLLWLA